MPQDKLETELARRSMVPFKDGLRPAEPVSEKTEQALKTVMRFSPTTRKVDEDGVNISENPLLNKLKTLLLGRLNGTANTETSWGGPGTISLAPSHIGDPEILAHEFGHERQRQLGLPIVNNKEADYLLNEMRENKSRHDRMFNPRPDQFARPTNFGQGPKIPDWVDPDTLNIIMDRMDGRVVSNAELMDEDLRQEILGTRIAPLKPLKRK